MKNIKYFLLLCATIFLTTGCVKFNGSMDIKKNKQMNFTIIYAVDTSMFGDTDPIDKEDKQELEKQGYEVSEYKEGNFKGVKIIKKVKNIDEVSTDSENEYDLSGMLDQNNAYQYIFRVKKGLFKNTYIAKLKFDSSDGGLETPGQPSIDSTDIWDTDNNGFGNMDLSGVMSNMDLSFNVKLPNAAKSHNATTATDGNKTLKWDLSAQEAQTIEFEFEINNRIPMYLGIGLISFLVIAIIAIFVGSNMNRKNGMPIQQNSTYYQGDTRPFLNQEINNPFNNGTM